MKYILLTGGAGFIGANFLHAALARNEDWHFINLDKFTYAANINNLRGLDAKRHTLVRGDICESLLIKEIFEKFKIEGVINFAAESHVDNSIKSPKEFIRTNIEGAFNLLDIARQTWLEAPYIYKEEYRGARFMQISTDEVYGSLSLQDKESFTEQSPHRPSSPYSASKSAAEFLAKAYYKTYGLEVVVSNSSNNFGRFQHDEKLIPVIIRSALNGQKIGIYGDGSNVRDWVYVDDNCAALYLIFNKGKSGDSYNISSSSEISNLALAQKICALLDEICPCERKYGDLISFVADRPGHDKRYSLDASKLKSELGWRPQISFDEALKNTVLFYVSKYKQSA